MSSSFRRILLSAAVVAAALAAAGPASAVVCFPTLGSSLPFNPINPTSANQLINNAGQTTGGAFTCQIEVAVNNASPATLIAADISDVTQSLLVGNSLNFTVVQNGITLLANGVANLAQQVFSLTGPVVAGIPLFINESGVFANVGFNGSLTAEYTIRAVPAPIIGAGLPGLVLACGGLLALARRRRQQV